MPLNHTLTAELRQRLRLALNGWPRTVRGPPVDHPATQLNFIQDAVRRDSARAEAYTFSIGNVHFKESHMAGEEGVAGRDAKSNFERTTEKIVEKTGGNRENPKSDLTHDNDGKAVGAREAHDKNTK